MPKIFISYRRDDTLGLTGRIFDRLKSHFGSNSVVMDIDSIPFGADFIQYITDAISECDVLLAIIGDRWLGSKRLDDSKDFVRLEIETALNKGLLLIPILVGTAPMPREDELPTPLKNLTSRNAIRIDTGRDFHHHVDRLIQAVDLSSSSRRIRHEPIRSHNLEAEKEQSPRLTPFPVRAVVEIASGTEKGRSIELVKDRVLIGRAPDCDICLDTAFLSGYHAQFVRVEEGYGFEDLATTNGSYINGFRVNGRVMLKDGDRIHAGQTILVYRTS